MTLFDSPSFEGHEGVHAFSDEKSGLKTIIAYRGGFDLDQQPPSDSLVVEAAGQAMKLGETGSWRLTDRTLLMHCVPAAHYGDDKGTQGGPAEIDLGEDVDDMFAVGADLRVGYALEAEQVAHLDGALLLRPRRRGNEGKETDDACDAFHRNPRSKPLAA